MIIYPELLKSGDFIFRAFRATVTVTLASIVIPTYNRADILPRAIDSSLSQTYNDIEIIIVDDGSTDNTENVVESYSDERIRYHKLKENSGANAARNKGVSISKGKYISFLDSDDELTSNHIEAVTSLLERTKSKIRGLYTGQKFVHKDTKKYSNSPNKKLKNPGQVIQNYPANGFSTFTFHREVFDEVGKLDEDLEACQDREFLIRYLTQYHLYPIEEPLVRYYIHEDRISSKPEKRIRGIESMVDKHADTIQKYDKSFIYYSKGHIYSQSNRIKKARKNFLKASKINKKNIKYHFHLVATIFGFTGYRIISKSKRIVKSVADTMLQK